LNLNSTIQKLKTGIAQMTFFSFREVIKLTEPHLKMMEAFTSNKTSNKVVIMFGKTGLGKSTAI
jgi:hypothetical protein